MNNKLKLPPSERSKVQLLGAVSLLGVSLGMAPVHAGQCAGPGDYCLQHPNDDKSATASGVKLQSDVIELKTNTASGQYTRKKLPGRMKSGTLTITRGANATSGGQSNPNGSGTSSQIKLDASGSAAIAVKKQGSSGNAAAAGSAVLNGWGNSGTSNHIKLDSTGNGAGGGTIAVKKQGSPSMAVKGQGVPDRATTTNSTPK